MGTDLAVSTGRDDLARGAIGLREVLFQSVTHMAPAGAVAFSIAVGATFAGGSLSLSVLLALVACLLVASSIGQLARCRFPNSLVGPIVGAWTLIGLVYLAYLASRQPRRLEQTERVFVEEVAP